MTPELFKRFKNMFSLKTILHTYQCIFHSSIQVISYEIVLNYELPSRDSSSSFSYFNGFIIMPCLYISKNSIKIVNPVSFKFTDQPSAYIYITPRILESYKIKWKLQQLKCSNKELQWKKLQLKLLYEEERNREEHNQVWLNNDDWWNWKRGLGERMRQSYAGQG